MQGTVTLLNRNYSGSSAAEEWGVGSAASPPNQHPPNSLTD